MKVQQICKRIKLHEDRLRKEFSVKAMYIFGSVARGEASASSDIDVLVEFSSENIGIFEFVRLKDFLESILSKNVDLVTRDALRDSMATEVERDSIRVA